MAAKWPLDLLRNWTTNYFECWLSLLGLKDNSSMVIQHLLNEYMLRLAQSKLINYPFASSSWREICLGKVKEGCRRVWILLSLSEVWALLVEGIVKEADKLACLVLFLLFQFHSTVRAHALGAVQVGNAHTKWQQRETPHSQVSRLF